MRAACPSLLLARSVTCFVFGWNLARRSATCSWTRCRPRSTTTLSASWAGQLPTSPSSAPCRRGPMCASLARRSRPRVCLSSRLALREKMYVYRGWLAMIDEPRTKIGCCTCGKTHTSGTAVAVSVARSVVALRRGWRNCFGRVIGMSV